MRFKKIFTGIMILCMIFLAACGGDTAKEGKKNNNGDTQKNTDIQEAKEPMNGGSIVFPIGSDPLVLNPLYGNDRVTMTVNNALYDPLYNTNNGEVHYYLAESITPSEDYMTYTLKLKEGIKWHDGHALTTDDVIFTLQQILDPNQNSTIRENFIINGKPIEVDKINDLTVDFKLSELSMTFMGSLDQFYPIPKHIFEGEKDLAKSEKNDNPIGSGPFKFKQFVSGENVILERFDDYYGGKAHLDTVVYRVIGDENTSNIALQTGELSAKYIPANDAEKFSKDDKLKVFTFNEGMLNNMVFILNNETLKNKDIRQAIAYAIDKDELVKAAYISSDYADPAYSIFTPDTAFYTNDVKHFDYNLEKAKELMGKAGVENLNLKLAYINSKKDQESQGLVIQQRLKSIGINVELMALDRGAFYQKLLNPENTDFDMAFNGYVMGSEPDVYKSLFKTGQMYNFMGYSNSDIDDVWGKAAIEMDKEKRGELYKTIQQTIVDDMIEYPIAYPKSIVAINKKYGGIEEAKPAPIFMFEDLSKLYMTE
jgi:peptide/nickel transport system substrate-binding protein